MFYIYPCTMLTRTAILSISLLLGSTQFFAQGLLDAENLDQAFTDAQPGQIDQIPILFEDELEDIGPQYLLTPGQPAHDCFYALLDAQLLYVSNPTLAEDAIAEGTDLLVFTAQIETRTRFEEYFGGKALASLGMRYQVFRYGSLSDPDELIGGSPASDNDFEAATFYGYVKWIKDKWTVRFGLNWTQLDNDTSDSGFYKELSPNISVTRFFSLSNDTALRIGYTGSWFISESENFDLPRDDFNDRITNQLFGSLRHQLFEKLSISPGIRISYAYYIDDLNGDREDINLGANLYLSYEVSTHASLRFQSSLQKRYSSNDVIVDYDSYDFGFGGTFSYQF